jgi:predicted nucleotidyltransferase
MDIKIRNDLELFKEKILKIVPVEAIYLFGSYAYGTPNDESDLDIFLVVPDDITDLSELYADIRLLWRKNSVPIDLLISRSSVFNRRMNGATLEKMVAQKGTLLYGS